MVIFSEGKRHCNLYWHLLRWSIQAGLKWQKSFSNYDFSSPWRTKAVRTGILWKTQNEWLSFFCSTSEICIIIHSLNERGCVCERLMKASHTERFLCCRGRTVKMNTHRKWALKRDRHSQLNSWTPMNLLNTHKHTDRQRHKETDTSKQRSRRGRNPIILIGCVAIETDFPNKPVE